MDKVLNQSYQALSQTLAGDLLLETADRQRYACDASIFQQLPQAVARPHNLDDCQKIMAFAREQQIPVIPRAGGTSLAGQAVGSGLVVDVSRYMNNILNIDEKHGMAVVQPGVIPDVLNRQVAPLGLMFAPDPSTYNRCNIGGMMANNAWGAHSPLYGSTRDHILAQQVLLSSGQVLRLEPLEHQQLAGIQASDSPEHTIIKSLIKLVDKHRNAILDAYPKDNNLICNAGYALQVLATGQPWQQHGPVFNAGHLLCGSEGTLGLSTELTVKLVPLNTTRQLLVLHFDNVLQALETLPLLHQHRPHAIELLDQTLLHLCRQHPALKAHSFWIKPQAGAVLLVEYLGGFSGPVSATHGNKALNDNIQTLLHALYEHFPGITHTQLIDDQCKSAWLARRAGLGLLMGVNEQYKPVTFVEDSAVPLEHLAAFVAEFQQVMQQVNRQCVYYGSVSRGLIHLRPYLDLNQARDKALLQQISEQCCALLLKYQGTLSAKHGDGRLRSPFLQTMLGKNMVTILQEVKQLFDPLGLMNPDTLNTKTAAWQPLRESPSPNGEMLTTVTTKDPEAFFNWERDRGLLNALNKCNGAGACRVTNHEQVMCPSYKVTLEEQHCTRGRANLLRQVAKHKNKSTARSLAQADIREALSLCLACKSCLRQCPAQVDMARLKAEHLYQYQQQHGVPWQSLLLAQSDRPYRLLASAPGAGNWLLGCKLLKRVLGLHPQCQLPVLTTPLSRWWQRHSPPGSDKTDIVFLNTTLTETMETAPARAVLEVFQAMGFKLQLSPVFASLRILISLGLLDRARQILAQQIHWLMQSAAGCTYITGSEPAEILSWRDEAIDLLAPEDKANLKKLTGKILLFEEIMLRHADAYSPDRKQFSGKILLVHPHCHQRALAREQDIVDCLALSGASAIQLLPASCCGMAGDFGLKKQTYELGRQIGELALFPAVRAADNSTIVVATGGSCRQQLRQHLQHQALHPAQVLNLCLDQ